MREHSGAPKRNRIDRLVTVLGTKDAYKRGFADGWDNPNSSEVDNPFELNDKRLVDYEVGFRNGSKQRLALS